MKKKLLLVRHITYVLITTALRLWVTTMTALVTYIPLSELAYAERGYKAIGGEIVPVAIVAGAVWVGMGWLIQEWYKMMVRRDDSDRA